jgi:phosphatidylserine decarboxylase
VLLGALSRLPQGALSRITGRIADLRIPRPLRAPLLGAFVRATGIDMTEAELPLVDHATLDTLFTRRLRPHARDWPADADTVTSPVDGITGACGIIRDGLLLQAKGRQYTAGHLLDEGAARFEGGAYATFYLSPRHYHRVHAPLAGRISRLRHVPGALLPVNPPALSSIDELFPRNERMICWIEAEHGNMALVAVGAYNVGRISTAFDASARSNRRGATSSTRTYDPAIAMERGAEVFTFHLGSTVVLLFERELVQLQNRLVPGQEIRLGAPIAMLQPGRR